MTELCQHCRAIITETDHGTWVDDMGVNQCGDPPVPHVPEVFHPLQKITREMKHKTKGTYLWPSLTTAAEIEHTITQAAYWAFATAVITGLIGGLSAVMGTAVGPFDGTALLDAAIWAVIGWRIRRYSQPWAISGVLLWVAGNLTKLDWSFETHRSPPIGIVTAFCGLALINGVRALRAYDRLTDPTTPVLSPPIVTSTPVVELDPGAGH